MRELVADTISNEPPSPPEPTVYVGFCPSRAPFCAAIVATTVSLSRTSVSAGTIYQLPRFWAKEVAPVNMPPMSVAPETSQEPRGWLKAAAPQNMEVMSVTFEMSQEPRGRLKAAAL